MKKKEVLSLRIVEFQNLIWMLIFDGNQRRKKALASAQLSLEEAYPAQQERRSVKLGEVQDEGK